MLSEGDLFPDFSLSDGDGQVVTRDSLRGRRAVVYFYPKDDTPGCTAEACELNERLPRFEGVRVYGVSPDAVKSHKKFAEKFGLGFPLLADEDHKLAEDCGLWVEKSMYGKKYWGVDRATFVLDADARVAKIFPKVKPQGHAEEILAALGTLS